VRKYANIFFGTVETVLSHEQRRLRRLIHVSVKKPDLLEWAEYNSEQLTSHELFATGTTGRLLQENLGFSVTRLQSGPLGGDQQLGARIAESTIDVLIFSGTRWSRCPTTPT
jgi:methylglyoxal synthase